VKATSAAGFHVLQNNDACAGQEIPHAHFHVIPRDPDDGFKLGWRQGHYSDGQLEELQGQILSFL
jgi:histidine triad (HIT) family protein